MKKLVRDKIPTLMLLSDRVPKVVTITDNKTLCEYIANKIVEEAKELAEAILDNNADAILEELADCQEILDKLIRTLAITDKNLQLYRYTKTREKGSFNDNLVVDFGDDADAK